MIEVSPQTIRRLAIEKQQLAEPASPTPEGLNEVMRAIRCLQIDPIRAVERTQYLVLFSRLGSYPMELLDVAAYRDKTLFEYWAHAASYVLTEDYPIHNYKMRNIRFGGGIWAQRYKAWLETNRAYERYVLETVREQGPLLVTDLEDRAETPWESGGWSSNRNATMMVSALWDRGKLFVTGRDGNKKYWDLAERILPDWTPRETVAAPEVTRRAAQYALKGLGVGTIKHINNHFTRNRYPHLESVLADLVADGLVHQAAAAQGADALDSAGPWYVHADDLPRLEQLEADDRTPRTVLLSPFDNLICDRDRTELLWDFFFRIEIYVPAKDREYGYYVLPILHGDRLIGRIDPLMDRKSGTLRINAVYREENAPDDSIVIDGIRDAIRSLGEFLGAGRIEFSVTIPPGWKGITRL